MTCPPVMVYDTLLDLSYPMHSGRAAYNILNHPDRFSYSIQTKIKKGNNTMSPKTTQSPKKLGKTPSVLDVKKLITPKKPRSQKRTEYLFSDFQPATEHRRLDEMIDETIYIVGIQPQNSETFGTGYKLTCKDAPDDDFMWTASCFSQYIVPVLENLYNLSHEGSDIDEYNYIKTTIQKAGNTYRFT